MENEKITKSFLNAIENKSLSYNRVKQNLTENKSRMNTYREYLEM